MDAADPLDFSPVDVNLKSLQNLALENRPEVRSADAAIRADRAAVGLQRSQYYPDVVLGRNFSSQSVEVGLTMPLVDFGSIRGSIHQSQETVEAQQAQAEQTRESVLLDTQTAYLALTQARSAVDAYSSGILPRTESLLKKTEQGYGLGASPMLDLIDAQQTYRSTHNDYDSAIGDYRHALAQLERACGCPLTSILSQGAKTR